MYFSVKHINVKLNQDYADFNESALIICDGIGEFHTSGKISKLIVDQYISKNYKSISELIFDEELMNLKDSNFVGGTTFISAINLGTSNKIRIEYLGNGGIIHFYGDFSSNVNSQEPYRYGELMIPHISSKGALTRHISHNSDHNELLSSIIDLHLNYHFGDIIMLFSDGIASLEDKIILKDDKNRYWRSENPSIQLILRELDSFLKSNSNKSTFHDSLIEFNQKMLGILKSADYLEDDASLGFIITDKVLDYYNSNL